MEKALKKLRITYYSIYLAVVIVAFIGLKLFRSGIFIDNSSQIGIAIYSILILIVIVSIPLSMAIYNKKTKKWALMEDKAEKIRLYTKGGIICMGIIGLDFLLGIFFYFLLNSQNMLILAGIAAIALLFCKPAMPKIIADLQIEDE